MRTPAPPRAGCFSRARVEPLAGGRRHSPAALGLRPFPSLGPHLDTHLSKFSDLIYTTT